MINTIYKKPLVTLLIIIICLGNKTYCQDELAFDKDFLTILILPYVKSGERISQYIDGDQLVRKVIGKITGAFNDKGYRVKDYISVIKLDKRVPEATDLERTPIKQAIKNAGVDIIVYTEIDVLTYEEGDKQLQLLLSAVDQYSAESYAAGVIVESNRRFYNQNTISKAIGDNLFRSSLDTFVKKLDKKFLFLLRTGRTITIKMRIDPKSTISFGTKLDDKNEDLITALENWVSERVNRIYSSSSDMNYWQAECNLPIIDKNGKQVSPRILRSGIKTYLESIALNGTNITVVENVLINTVLQILVE